MIIDKEFLMIICIGSSVILGMLGGTQISTNIKGQKWLRRFLLPVILGSIALMAHFEPYRVLGFILCLIGSLCLPYGERTPYWGKTLTFMAIFGSTIWLEFNWWQPIGVVLAIALFKISNTKWGQSFIFWKAWEAITFGLLGITIASAIGR